MFIKQAILAFLATASFAAFFSEPKDVLIPTGIIGMVGWLIYFYMENLFAYDKFISIFIASLTVSVLGELSAKKFKKPATLFTIPGLLPLVPGAGVYYTMFNLVNKLNYSEKGVETLLTAGAIALGIIVSSVFSNSIKRKIY